MFINQSLSKSTIGGDMLVIRLYLTVFWLSNYSTYVTDQTMN